MIVLVLYRTCAGHRVVTISLYPCASRYVSYLDHYHSIKIVSTISQTPPKSLRFPILSHISLPSHVPSHNLVCSQFPRLFRTPSIIILPRTEPFYHQSKFLFRKIPHPALLETKCTYLEVLSLYKTR